MSTYITFATLNSCKRVFLATDSVIAVPSGTLTISGPINGPGGFTKVGAGTLLLTMADFPNTYTGQTIVAEGVLSAGIEVALGSTAAGTTVADGATLELACFGLVEPLTLNGAGVGGMGVLRGRTTSGSSCIGPITLASDTTIGAWTTDFTIGIGGAVGGSGALRKVGPGQLVLSRANTYTGQTTVTEGVLTVTDSAALGSAASDTVVASGAALCIGLPNQQEHEALTINEPLTLNGTGVGGTGALMAGNYECTWLGPITLATDATIDVTYCNLTVSGQVSGGGRLTKTGDAVLEFSAASTYTGSTIIEDGVLRATDGVGLPKASNLVLAGGVWASAVGATFTRSLGTGAGEVQWTGSGGFSSYGGNITVAIGGTASPTPLTWGSGGFVPIGSELILSSASAGYETEFSNSINLANGDQTIRVKAYCYAGIDDAAFATISGILSNGSLTKTGWGKLVLSAANTYAGTTTVAEGILCVGHASALGSTASGTTVASGATVELGTVTCSEPLTLNGKGKDDTGALHLRPKESAGTWAGPITLATDSYIGTPAPTGYHAGTLTVSGVITGAGQLGIVGTGTVILSATNDYMGGTYVSNTSTLRCGAPGAIPNGSDIRLGGVLDLNGFSATLGGLANSGAQARVTLGGATLTVGANGSSGAYYYGAIEGAGTLIKTGDGLQTLSGAGGAMTYTGPTIIQGGVLRATDGLGFPAGSDLVLAAGVLESMSATTFTRVLGTAGGQVQWTGSGGFSAYGGKMTVAIGGTASPTPLTWGSGYFVPPGSALILGSASADNETEFQNSINLGGTTRTITVNDNPAKSTDFATISGTLSNGALVKDGPGLLVIAGAHTYTGPTTVSAGTLSVASGAAIATSGFIVEAGATLEATAAAADKPVTLNGTGVGATGALRGGSAAVTWNGPVTLATDSAISASAAPLTIAGPIDGGGSLTKIGTGLLGLTGANLYTGATVVQAGLLRANEGAGLPAASNLVFAGGLLESDGSAILTRGMGTGAGQVQWTGSGGFSAYGGKLTVAFGGTASPTPLTWGSGGFVPSGLALVFGSTTADSDTEFRNSIDLGGATQTITVNDNPAAMGDFAALCGTLSNGGLTKTGNGTLLLSAANTYAGPTTVSAGTLRCIVPGAIPSGSAVTVNGTMDLNGFSAAFSGLSGTGSVVCGTASLALGAGDGSGTFSGIISGTGGLTKTGSGLQVLSGTNTYGGSTIIEAGVLRAADGKGLPTTSNLALAGGVLESNASTTFTRSLGTGPGQVQWTGSAGFSAYGGQMTVNIGGGSGTLTWGTGGFVPDGSSLILGSVQASNRTYLRNGIDFNGMSRTITVNDNPGTTNDNAAIDAILSNGGLTKDGTGMLELLQANTYTGPTVISAGTLRYGKAGAIPAVSDVTVNGILTFGVSNPALKCLYGTGTVTLGSYTLSVGASDGSGSFDGVIGGTGGLTKIGQGTQVLWGNDTYSGTTSIQGGVLRAADGAGLPNSSRLSLAGGLLESVGEATFTRNLASSGANTLRWTASGGFSASGGKMTVALGGIASPTPLTWGSGYFVPVGSALLFGSATADNETEFMNSIDLAGAARTVTVNDNAFSDTDFATLSGTLSNGGLKKDGLGLLVLKGSHTYTGATTISAGMLKLAAGATTASTLFDVAAGAALDVQDLAGGLTLGPGTTIKGGGSVLGDLVVGGTLAPGESPGLLSVDNVTFADGSTLAIELGGTARGTEYDALASSGTVTLESGSVLSVVLVGAFAPAMGDAFDILDFASLTGEFSMLGLPALGGGLTWDTDDLYSNGTLGVAPEPATLALLAAGVAGALLHRRRRR